MAVITNKKNKISNERPKPISLKLVKDNEKAMKPIKKYSVFSKLNNIWGYFLS